MSARIIPLHRGAKLAAQQGRDAPPTVPANLYESLEAARRAEPEATRYGFAPGLGWRVVPDNLYDSFAEALQPDLPTFRDYLAGWVESRFVCFLVGGYVGVFLTLVSAVVAS